MTISTPQSPANSIDWRDWPPAIKSRLLDRLRAIPTPPDARPLIRTDADLAAYVRDEVGITIPAVRVCPDHAAPFDAFAAAYFARSPVVVWKASRGFGGKSFLLALLGHVEANTIAADVSILGGSGEQSARVLEYLQRFAGDEANTKRRTQYRTGGRITALMASSTSVRGPHPQRLRIDEVDEIDLAILDASFGQPMRRGDVRTQIVLSSTHHYPDGTMTEVLRRAVAGDWPVFCWCYRETSAAGGWLTADEIAEKRTTVSSAMWTAEYDLQDPSPEGRAILSDSVRAMFDRARGEFEGRPDEYLEFEAPVVVCPKCGREAPLEFKSAEGDATATPRAVTPPDCPDCRVRMRVALYETGVDWAKEKDWTVIDTFRVDVWPRRRVAWERTGRKPWPIMVDRLDRRVARFPGASTHDATGIGGVVDDYQRAGAEGVVLSGRTRADIFTAHIAAIESGALVSPYIDFAAKEYLYCRTDDLFGGGHPPDSFVAGALATFRSVRPRPRVNIR